MLCHPPSSRPGPPSRPHQEPFEKPIGESIARLLRDLPQLRRGSAVPADPASERLASGIPAVDELLAGGFPAGRLSEITGPHSSGRTALALGLVARATRRGQLAAWVDAAQALDPASLEAAGASLARLLWVRPPELRTALRCCQCLLEAHGFALVVLDRAGGAIGRPLAASSWQRLARMAAGTGTALVVISPQRTTGGFADLALSLQPTRAHFSGVPALLEGLETRVVVEHRRRGPVRSAAAVRLSADPRAA